MAFPQSALIPRVRIAPGADPGGSPGDWTWADITSDVRVESGIDIEVGRQDEGKRVDPGKCTLTVNNAGGHYSPRCPNGRWYGLLAKNTPIEVTIPYTSADNFQRTQSAGWGSTPDGQPWDFWFFNNAQATVAPGAGKFTVTKAQSFGMCYLSILTTDVDMTATVTSTAGVPVGGNLEPLGFMVRVQDPDTYYLMRAEVAPGGSVVAKIYAPGLSGVPLAQTTVAGLTWSAGMKLAGRANATGATLSFRVWDATKAEPAGWTLQVTDKTYVGAGGIGLRSGIGAGVTSPAFPVTFSWSSFAASTWAERFAGTVPEWPPRWDLSGKDAFVPIQAAGALRRLAQGASPLRSVIYRQIAATKPAAYWSMEEGAQSQSLAEYHGGTPMTWTGSPPTRASGGPPGSAPCITLAADTSLHGIVTPYPKVVNEWGVQFNVKMPDAGGQDYPLLEIRSNGDVPIVQLMYAFNDGGEPGHFWRWWNKAGNMSSSSLTAAGAVFPDGKFHGHDAMIAVHLYPSSTSGQLTLDGAWSSPDFKDPTAVGGAYLLPPVTNIAGTNVGQVTDIWINSGNGYPRNGWEYGHIGVWNGVSAQAWGSLVGNSGESAHGRIIRLCKEEGVALSSDAFQYTSELMGAQPIDSLLNIIRECEETDAGVIYERSYGLAYQPRTYRHANGAGVAMTLNFAAGDVAAAPEPTDDDQQLRNDVTVSRKGGSSYRAQWTTGPNRISLAGRYDDSVDLSLAGDAQLPHQAWWRAHLGTNADMRWPRVPVNFAARPNLIGSWLACRPGSRINVLNPPAESGDGSTLDLFVEGYAERIEPYGWDVVANCSPATHWYVIVLDSDRLEADPSSTLVSAIDATANTFIVGTNGTAGAAWTTDPAEWSNGKTLDLDIEGERIRVTNITTTNSTRQTFTVTRSINGIVKAHPAGAYVGLWKPRVLAL